MINLPVSKVVLDERTSKKGNSFNVVVLTINGKDISLFADSFAVSHIQSVLLELYSNRDKGGVK